MRKFTFVCILACLVSPLFSQQQPVQKLVPPSSEFRFANCFATVYFILFCDQHDEFDGNELRENEVFVKNVSKADTAFFSSLQCPEKRYGEKSYDIFGNQLRNSHPIFMCEMHRDEYEHLKSKTLAKNK